MKNIENELVGVIVRSGDWEMKCDKEVKKRCLA